jgi:transposase InsO family protein
VVRQNPRMPAIRVARKLKAINVIDILSDLFILRGIPGHIRFDNGPEFVAEAVQKWIAAVGAKTAYIERGRPWENGYIESFNARLPRARSPPSLPERSCPWHPQWHTLVSLTDTSSPAKWSMLRFSF